MLLTVKKLLQQHSLKPSKRLGQNFLISQRVLQKIIQTANLSQEDVVLEIGPGLGILTQELAKRTKKVIAVEKDKKMVEILKEVSKECKNVKIIHGDILKLLRSKAPKKFLRSLAPKYKVVANIPYYLTSPLIRLLLESNNPPQEMILLVQKEVAQRICAKPPKMSLLAVAVQFYSQPKIISHVSKESFWPRPQVDSTIIKIGGIKKPKNINIKRFFQIVKAGFSSPRKQLANNLSKGLNLDREKIKKALTECNLDIQVRAGNLSVENWIKLSTKINSFLMV
jgi:16S rRNA (adenine1518-N6/adenine1519-N6)-dimethyltransferase